MKSFAVYSIFLLSFFSSSCALYDETSGTVNFWDFKNAVVKEWKNDPDSFRPIDLTDSTLMEELTRIYGKDSFLQKLGGQEVAEGNLPLGSPDDDYFGFRYYYKFYTKEAPLESALGSWTGSVLYVVYSDAHQIIESVMPDTGIDTIYCRFMAEGVRENRSSPGTIDISVLMDCGTKIILDGYAVFRPANEDEKALQRMQAANLKGMYMTGFDVTFSETEEEETK